jgi:predicted glycosyltransferase
MADKLRIFCYAQHLSGVGHIVRTQQIAVALANRHRVAILDGGREVPFPEGPQRVTVARITRRDGDLVSLDTGLSLQQSLASRRARLQQVLEQMVPDAILVEHFPFSKWELKGEVDFLLSSARRLNPDLKAVCSVRDIVPRTRYESAIGYESRVADRLNRQFDALLVHGDPQLCSLGDYFSRTNDIEIPVRHTGIVVPQSAAPGPSRQPSLPVEGGHVVASIGGGADQANLLSRVTRAWRQLVADGVAGPRVLLLFGGLGDHVPGMQAGAETGDRVCSMGFDPAFRYWLQSACLSISCAGYNTCANLLVSGTPALLLPNPKMSDQQERARLLAKRGVARLVPAAETGQDPLPQLIADTIGHAPVKHSLNIDGAGESVRSIEKLVSGLQLQ